MKHNKINKAVAAKVVSWRVVSITITMLLMSFIMGDVKEASKVTIMLHILLTFFHYIFEMLWGKFNENR